MKKLTGFDPGEGLTHAKRIVLCITPPDILDHVAISFQWTRLINRYGGEGRDASGVLGFLIGENYVLCPYAYRLLSEEQIAGKEKICMLVRRDTYLNRNLEMIADYTSGQYRQMKAYMAQRESEGFRLFFWEKTYGVNALFKRHVITSMMKETYPVLISAEDEFPLAYLDHLDSMKDGREACMTLYQKVRQSDDPFLARQFLTILSGEGTAARFYDLMKIAEYCIHVRALLALSDPSGKRCDPPEEIYHLAVGTMEELQRPKHLQKPDKPVQLTLIRALSSLRGEAVKSKSADYNLCCATIAVLRNKYVGHGTLIYHVSEEMLYHLSVITGHIMTYYLANSHKPDSQSFIMPEKYAQCIPAVRIINNSPWYFEKICRFKETDCTSYLNFENGRHLFFTMEGSPIRDTFILDRGIDPQVCEMPPAPDDLPQLLPNTINSYRGAVLVNRFLFDVAEIQEMEKKEPNKSIIEGSTYGNIEGYFRKISQNKRYDAEIIHHLAIMAQSPVSFILVSGHVWDRHLEYTINLNLHFGTPRDPAFLDDMTFNAILIGFLSNEAFLPWASIHICVFGECRYRHQVKDLLPWIRSVDVCYFETMEKALQFGLNTSKSSANSFMKTFLELFLPATLAMKSISRIINKSRMLSELIAKNQKLDYSRRQVTYLQIIREIGLKSPLLYPGNNIFNAGFIKNILEFSDITTAVIALFDYMEFICLLMSHYVFSAHHFAGLDPDVDSCGRPIIPTDDNSNIIANFKSNCQEILYYMPESAPCYEDIHYGYINVPPRLKQLHKQLGKIFSCDIVSDRMTFINLASLIGTLRNNTKGHGYIRGLEANVLWEVLFYDAMMLNRFLHLNEFKMDAYNCIGTIGLGYPDMRYSVGIRMFIDDNHVPSLLYSEDHRGRLKYMNYFDGTVTVPEMR